MNSKYENKPSDSQTAPGSVNAEFKSLSGGIISETTDLFKTAHGVLLIGYTIFIIMHITITFLLGWDKWILIPMLAGLLVSWGIHITEVFTLKQRLWMTAGFMMCSYFIYGTHITSTYDLSVVMASIIMLFIMTRVKGIITLCQITFYITFTYDLVSIAMDGGSFDILLICRITMHYAVITMIAGFVKTTINKWNQVVDASRDEIAELTDSARRLNDFLANVSHEIRTPVNAVIGLSGICIDKEKDPEIKKDMQAVRKAGHRVAEQIGDILDYSEIDKGNLVKNCEDFMLTSLINDLFSDFREIKKPEIELVLDIDPQVPAVMNSDVAKLKKIIKALVSNGLKFTNEGGVYLKLSAEKQSYGVNLCIEVSDTGVGMSEEEKEKALEPFYQSDSGRSRSSSGLGLGLGIANGFVALLGGFMVIDSTPGKGTTVKVSLPMQVISEEPCMSLLRPKELVVCTYIVYGSYKNPQVREYHSQQLKNLVKGLNLELYRAENSKGLETLNDTMHLTHLFVGAEEYTKDRGLVERLAESASVLVVADPGFTLPAGSKARLVEKPFYGIAFVNILNTDSGNAENAGRQLMTRDVNALVVDDEQMNLVVAKSILGRYGMKVTTAVSGSDAVSKCRDTAFSIIFMDHMMSGMDGVEALKRIRADVKGLNHDSPIVALTANAMSSARQMFMSEGFDGFVSKPIEVEELERTMKKLLPKESVYYTDTTDLKVSKSSEGKKDSSKDGKKSAGKANASNSKMISAEKTDTSNNKKDSAGKNDDVKTGNGDRPEKNNNEASASDDILEFDAACADDEILEFAPADEDETMEFSPSEDDDAFEFAPSGNDEPLEFTPSEDDDAFEFTPDESENLSPGKSSEIIEKLNENGLDTESGLSFCAGDRELYFKILFGFALEMDQRIERLNTFYNDYNLADYEINIHSTKSTAKMVGAMELSAKALKLENAAHDGDVEYIKNNHSSVMADCGTLSVKILSAVGDTALAKKLAGGEE